MTMLRRAIQRELVDFLDHLKSGPIDISQVSKVAFCKARKKLKFDSFIKLNDILLGTFYKEAKSGEIELWNGHRLLATDGSTAEVPNSLEVQQEWGVFQERSDGKKICMARLLQVYDVLNHMSIGAAIDSINVSESALFWNQLNQIESTAQDLHVFDRYYASHLLIFHLDARRDDYCFRMKKNWWKVVEKFYNSEENDRIITLKLPKKDQLTANSLDITASEITCRLTKIVLDSGEIEVLLTSLTDQSKYSRSSLKELYGLRWGVETFFSALKHKAELENFSGKSINNIKQDYFAKIFILNYTSLLIQPVDKLLTDNPKRVYIHKVNLNEALARMKHAVIDLFLFGEISDKLKKLFESFYFFTEPIRKNRKHNRPNLPKRKYHRNYAHV